MAGKEPQYEGLPIVLGRREYIVPPLNLGRLRQALPLIEKVQLYDPRTVMTASGAAPTSLWARIRRRLLFWRPPAADLPETLEAIVSLIHLCLQRNYPEMTRQELEEGLDIQNIPEALRAIMGLSGLVQGEPGPGSPEA